MGFFVLGVAIFVAFMGIYLKAQSRKEDSEEVDKNLAANQRRADRQRIHWECKEKADNHRRELEKKLQKENRDEYAHGFHCDDLYTIQYVGNICNSVPRWSVCSKKETGEREKE